MIINIVPVKAFSSPAITFKSVDLPLPFFPNDSNVSPLLNAKVISLNKILSGVYPKLTSFTSSKNFAAVLYN